MNKIFPVEKLDKLIDHFEQLTEQPLVPLFLKALKDVQQHTLMFIEQKDNTLDFENVENAYNFLKQEDNEEIFFKRFFLEKSYCDLGATHEAGLPSHIIISHLEKCNIPELALTESEKTILNIFQNYATSAIHFVSEECRYDVETGETVEVQVFNSKIEKSHFYSLLIYLKEANVNKTLFSQNFAMHLFALLKGITTVSGSNNNIIQNLLINYANMAVENDYSILNFPFAPQNLAMFTEQGKPVELPNPYAYPFVKTAEVLRDFIIKSSASIESSKFKSVY